MAGLRYDPELRTFVWQTDVQQHIRGHNPFTPDAVNWGFYGDGTESGASLLTAGQDQNYTADISGGDVQVQLRVQIDETGTDTGASNVIYSFQYEKNDSGTWNTLATSSGSNVRTDTTSSITDAAATTDRLTGGSGTFGAGETIGGSGADSLTSSLNVPSAGNHTEIVIAMILRSADLANGDTLDFRVLADASTFAATMGQPRITISSGPALNTVTLAATTTATASLSRKASFFRTLAATATGVADMVAQRVASLTDVSLAATMTSSAALARAVTYAQKLAATVTANAGSSGTSEIIIPRRSGFTTVKPPLTIPHRNSEWAWFWDHCAGAFFPFNEDAQVANGATIRDWSPYRNAGTVDNSSGDITLGQTRYGKALIFSGDATNDRVNLGSISSVHPLNFGGRKAMSWVAGLKYSGTENSQFPRIFDKSDAGNVGNGYGTWYDNSANRFVFMVNNSLLSSWEYSVTLGAGDVFQLGFSMSDVTADTGQFYRDGLPVTTTTPGTNAPSIPSATTNAAIGNWNHTTDRMWGGLIDYVYIFDAAAPAVFLRKIYADPFGPFRRPPSLVPVGVGSPGGLGTRVTYSRKLNATSTMAAAISRVMTYARSFAATMTGNAAISVRRTFSSITLAATMAGSATISRVVTYARKLAATMTAVATVTAQQIGVATLTNVTLAATATINAKMSIMQDVLLQAFTTVSATLHKNFSTIFLNAKTGSLALKANEVRFDGTARFVEWSAGFSGVSDGRQITMAWPFNRRGGSGQECLVYCGTGSGKTVYLGFTSDNYPIAELADAGQTILSIVGTTAYSDNIDRVLIFSADLDGDAWLKVDALNAEKPVINDNSGSSSVGGGAPLYTVSLNATAQCAPVVRPQLVQTGNLDFTDVWRIGSTDVPDDWYSGSSGHGYVEFAYYDPGDGVFYSAYADGPIDHGSDGAAMTGVRPALYWVPTADDPTANNGTGGAADSASTFSDETSPPTIYTVIARMATRSTFAQKLAATMTAVASIATQLFRNVRLAATATMNATLNRTLFLNRTLAATVTANATINRVAFYFRTLAATMTGLASITATKLGGSINTVMLAATMTANATVSLVVTYSRKFAATMTGSATISRLVTYMRNISASTTVSASISERVTYLRTLAATLTGSASVTVQRAFTNIVLAATTTANATLTRTLLLFRTLSATVTASATITRAALFFRTLSATATMAASITRGAAFTLYTVSLNATTTISAGLSYIYTIFKRPFTGHGGLGMTEPGRWKFRRSAWRRRK